MGELSGLLNRDGLEITAATRRSAGAAPGCCARIVDSTISGKIAKEVFEAMWSDGRRRRCDHRGQGPASRSPTPAPSKR